jgi:hypothetical protein
VGVAVEPPGTLVNVSVMLALGLAVRVGVSVMLRVMVAVMVRLAVRVGLGVRVAVTLGLAVKLAVRVGVWVAVEPKGTSVKVMVGVGVSLGVAVGVGVPPLRTPIAVALTRAAGSTSKGWGLLPVVTAGGRGRSRSAISMDTVAGPSKAKRL